MSTLRVRGGRPVEGTLRVPGDKSISHRALLFAGAAEGTSVFDNVGPGQDVEATVRCLRAFGVGVERDDGRAIVTSRGITAWLPPDAPVDCGNSGTTMRILAGLAARKPFPTELDGDDSLRRRPMDRVAVPLRELGAVVRARDDRYPPLRVEGRALVGRRLDLPVASAQVKSCLILAGLGAEGTTGVVEPVRSRDHTERMLDALGVPIRWDVLPDARVLVEVQEAELPPFDLDIPGDASSAAFVVAAGVLAGRVRVDDVGLNPTRTGFLDLLARMGADVRWAAMHDRLGEPVGPIEATSSRLSGTAVEGPFVPLVVDELPLAAVVATQAEGPTVVTGAGELRLKETDRIGAMVAGLRAMGARIDETPDGFVVEGPTPLRGARVAACGDHRIAMALAVAGLVAEGETEVRGFDAADVSWPGFAEALRGLGADAEVLA